MAQACQISTAEHNTTLHRLEKLFRFPRKKSTYRIFEIQMLILDDLWVGWMLFSMFVPVLIYE